MKKILELIKLLNGHNVYIQTHNFPDPDALASAYGLQYLLKQFDIDSKIVFDGTLSKLSGIRMVDYFDIEIFNANDFKDMNKNDYIVIIDAQKYNKNCTDLPGDEVACIDHHPTVIDVEYKYKDVRMVGACSSIIAEYFIDAGKVPSVNVATALLYGIKMDTNDFGRGVSELDVKMYYMLFSYADQKVLEKIQLNTIELTDLRAYGAAINNISLYKNIGFASIPFDCPDGLIAIISDFILALDVVEFSVVYSERAGGYKFSVRSELEQFDAGKITNSVLSSIGGNGGGHAFMAGGFLPQDCVDSLGENPRADVEQLFLKELFPDEDVQNLVTCFDVLE